MRLKYKKQRWSSRKESKNWQKKLGKTKRGSKKKIYWRLRSGRYKKNNPERYLRLSKRKRKS